MDLSLCTVLGYPILVTDPKKFLQAPQCQYLLILWWGGAEKTQSFGESFPKIA